MNELQKIESWRQDLALAETIEEIKIHEDAASALAQLARRQKISLNKQNEIGKYRVEVEAKKGEWLKEHFGSGKHDNRRNQYMGKVEGSHQSEPSKMPIHRNESARARKIANTDNDTIEIIEQKIQDSGDVITPEKVYKEIKKEEMRLSAIEKLGDKLESKRDIVFMDRIKAIPYDANLFYENSEYSNDRYGDKIMSLDDDKWYVATTLERFYHRETMMEFSLREYAMVQTFPIDYKFIGNRSSIKKQIGNAVAPVMGQYISRNLKGKTVGDLFAGCGGFSCGLHQNGITTKWAVEWDADAAKSYKLNYTDAKVILGNIKEVTGSDLEYVDIIVGGPPCQGFSNAGSYQKSDDKFGDDPRNVLYKEFVRIVNEIRPGEFIMENVKEIQAVKSEIISDFNEIGYDVECQLISGNEIGMKQNRKRVFFIGKKREDGSTE